VQTAQNSNRYGRVERKKMSGKVKWDFATEKRDENDPEERYSKNCHGFGMREFQKNTKGQHKRKGQRISTFTRGENV